MLYSGTITGSDDRIDDVQIDFLTRSVSLALNQILDLLVILVLFNRYQVGTEILHPSGEFDGESLACQHFATKLLKCV